MSVRIAWIALVLALCAPIARADSGPSYDTFLDIGVRAMNQKQYDVAITAFEEAYQLIPDQKAAYALARAYGLAWEAEADPTKLKRAVTLFREVLAAPDDDRKPKHPKSKELLAIYEPALAEIEAKQAAEGGGPIAEAKREVKTELIFSSKVKGTKIRFDDETEPRSTPVVIETTEGPHRVAAYADGYYTTTQDAIALPGQSLPFEVAMEPRPAVVTVRSSDDAEVAVDGVLAGRTNHQLEITAGEHRVEVRAPGRHVWAQQLHFDHGEVVDVDAPLAKTRKRKAIKWVAAAGGALLLGGGAAAWVAWDAQAEAEAFEDERRSGVDLFPEDLVEYDHDIDRRNRWRIISGWTLGAAGACLLGAVYLYFTDEPPPVVTGFVPGGATGSVAWSW